MNRAVAHANSLATIARWRARHIYRYRRPDAASAPGWTGYDQHRPRHRLTDYSGGLFDALASPVTPRHSTQETTHA